MLDEPVHLSAYDPQWDATFRSERERLIALLSPGCDVEHVGSTAVQGLLAKPVVDIMVGLSTVPPTSRLTEGLIDQGYLPLGEAGVTGRWYFRKRAGAPCNLHVVQLAGPLWEDNLALRDYLRRSADAKRRYEMVKRAAIAAGHRTLLAYSEAKARTLQQLVAEARAGRAQQ